MVAELLRTNLDREHGGSYQCVCVCVQIWEHAHRTKKLHSFAWERARDSPTSSVMQSKDTILDEESLVLCSSTQDISRTTHGKSGIQPTLCACNFSLFHSHVT